MFDSKFYYQRMNADAAFYSDTPWLRVSHRQIADASDSFARTVLEPCRWQISRSHDIPVHVIEGIKAAGWFGILIPKKFGGLGLDSLARVVNVQHIARACPDVGAMLQIAQLGTGTYIEHASPAQQEQWLPSLASGARVSTICVTEEGSGSHIRGIQTTYEERNGAYILNGEKSFIGNSSISNLHVVFARSKERPREFSVFIVEGERPGVDNTERHEMMGLKAFPLGRVRFHECEIPKENLVGRLGQGEEIIHKIISCYGRPGLTALALGIHNRVLDLAIRYSKERELYGKPISDIPDVRVKIFDIYRRFQAGLLSAYQAAHLQSIGAKSFRAVAFAKYVNGEEACQSALTATEIFGARVGLRDYEISQLLLDALMTRPPSGTSDVQRRRVMENLFGEKIPVWERESEMASA
jgi:alkylation response protein AidB-like acyl-CoA dehydrogenase